ncbi:CsgG/HfaB family protein [Sporohalobacter salinus]|uniref:CsgG/HfaB family protein n=1 Tax=Sporohalobacter salinus TaxID=1494606 RepID=UPI00195FF075|nr:CsgG/HfaB family protein [Sporohalobacter salinus]MBM7622828.1 curli biogenesis system outer membrane secretion channel CsgG [Sporohalobacter salinus]
MRKNKILLYLVLFFTLIILFTSINSYPTIAKEQLVAVMKFEEGDLKWKWFREDEILNGITQQVTDRLVEIDGIRVVERSRIDEVIKEQNFGQSGRLDNSSVAKLGKVLGVDFLIVGTLTRMEIKEKEGISVGPFNMSGTEAKVALSGRIVDVETAEIKESFKGEGKASDTSISISDLRGLSFGSESFSDSVLGKSIEKTVNKFVSNIEDDITKLSNSKKEVLKGRVVKVLRNKLIINIGKEKALEKGQKGKLIRLIKAKELDRSVELPIGEIEVFSVDNGASVVKVLKSERSPKKGDIIKFINE